MCERPEPYHHTQVHSDQTADIALDFAQLAMRVPFRRIQVSYFEV